jgi:glycosyltransferase involved in cell wall biosynthesis
MSEIATDTPFKYLQNVEDVDELKANVRIVLNEFNLKKTLEVEGFMESPTSWFNYIENLLKNVRKSSVESLKQLEILYWVDHTSRYEGNSGIQRVVRGLSESILNQGMQMTPVVWNPKEADFQLANKEQLIHLSNWSGPNQDSWNLEFASKPRNGINRILIIPELTTYSPDNHFLKKIILKAKSLEMNTSIIFFDALPLLMPDIYPMEAALKHSAYMDDLSGADAILAISNSARSDLVRHFLASDEINNSSVTKIWAISLPSLFLGETVAIQEINQIEFAQENKITILCVGTLELRKNYVILIEAFEKVIFALPSETIELIIVGKGVDSNTIKFVEQATGKLPIRWLGQVSDENLKHYYKICDFTVFPSLGEGFGLPLTESLGYGKPVICGSGGALQENALLGGCLVVNVEDSDALASGILGLITDSELLGRLKEEIDNRIFTSWNDYATNLLEVSFRIQKKVV